MKTDEEKAAIRSELGAAFFARLAEGVCPYCSKPLGPIPETFPNREQLAAMGDDLSACADCESVFGSPEFGGFDDEDDFENDDLDAEDEQALRSMGTPHTQVGASSHLSARPLRRRFPPRLGKSNGMPSSTSAKRSATAVSSNGASAARRNDLALKCCRPTGCLPVSPALRVPLSSGTTPVGPHLDPRQRKVAAPPHFYRQ